MKLLITRHPETKENVERVFQGNHHGNITEKGFQQLSWLIEKLRKEKIDLIISSDALRCKIMTAEILKHISAPVVYSELLREKDNSCLVGEKVSTIGWKYEDSEFETRKAEGGESLIDVKNRGTKFFQNVLKEHKNKNILIVSHGCFLKVLFGNLLNMSLKDSIFKLSIGHCSLSQIRVKDNQEYQITSINNQDFLEKIE